MASFRAGVRPGMTLAHARALLPEWIVHEHPHEPARDAAALNALANWAVRFAPWVMPDHPNGLLLDITGCERLYGDERRLVNLIGNSLDRLGYHAQIACAGTIGCAWAVARCGEHDRVVIHNGDEESVLRPLPVIALRLDERIVEALQQVGIETIAHLLEIPRLELAVRFDPVLLRRLDQALGEIDETINPIRPVEPIVVERRFDGPVLNLEAMLIVVKSLVDELGARLQQREIGAQRVMLHVERIDTEPLEIGFTLSRASREARHLWSLLKPRVEAMHLGYGVERLVLRAGDVQGLRHRQHGHLLGREQSTDDDDGDETTAALGELIDTLSHRLGPDRTQRLRVVESHRPERVAVKRPALERAARDREAEVIARDRPPVLFSPPEVVEVMAMTPDGPPISLRWRGQSRRIVAAHGPERIAGEWWRTNGMSHAPTRDYFRAQDESGRWLWLCRAGSRWFIHGQWS